MTEMTFEEWLEVGYVQGWIGPSICQTHDGVPLTPEEEEEFDGGGDPCVHVLRLYEDKSIKEGVEANHSPSVWRASNRGLTTNE